MCLVLSMSRKERFEAFIEYFSATASEPETELNYTNPFELLVAVVLSPNVQMNE